MPVDSHYTPDPRFLELGEGFGDVVEPARFPEHRLRYRNQRWAERVGLGGLTAEEWEGAFARFEALPGNLEEPVALRYHGHQFRQYNPELGDGRGFLFGQLRDPEDGRLLDLGTKGSGRTPYSRGGDGRLTLKGAVREVLATEMLEARGVNTSKTFSVFETGERLVRHDEPSPTRSAVLARLGHSHLRIGSFQYFSYFERAEELHRLMRYAARELLPELEGAAPWELPGELLRVVAARVAGFAAEIEAAGFVHGVLNTDNVCVTGESFDYGPWRFLKEYHPEFTAAYFDRTGLYAFGRQAEACRWALRQLQRALFLVCPVLCARERLEAGLEAFDEEFLRRRAARVLERLGLAPRGDGVDHALVERLYGFLLEGTVTHPELFFDLHGGGVERARAGARGAAYRGEAFEAMEELLREFEVADGVAARSDEAEYFSREGPETMAIEEVERVWAAIDREDDWGPFEEKVEAVREMGRAHGRELTPPAVG